MLKRLWKNRKAHTFQWHAAESKIGDPVNWYVRIVDDGKWSFLPTRNAGYGPRIALFSGAKVDNPKEIWLVDAAPKVIEKYKEAVANLNQFMDSQGLDCAPAEVINLKGDEARGEFINKFKEIQRGLS